MKHFGHLRLLAGSRPTHETPWTPRGVDLPTHKTPRGADLLTHTTPWTPTPAGGNPPYTHNTLDTYACWREPLHTKHLGHLRDRRVPTRLHTKHLGHLGVLAGSWLKYKAHNADPNIHKTPWTPRAAGGKLYTQKTWTQRAPTRLHTKHLEHLGLLAGSRPTHETPWTARGVDPLTHETPLTSRGAGGKLAFA